MARPLRIEYPGAFYHIINRGLERRVIYRSGKDYEYFLELFSRLHEKYGLFVHSYCLMPNHYHIYLETPNGGLSKIMRQLDGNYTQKFNKRYNRVGPLFQGRYKAILIDKDSYSLQLSKYMHLNPIKAKIVRKPEAYKWSSYSAFIGKTKPPAFLKTNWLLSQFNKSKRKTVKALKAFTLEAEEENWSPIKEAYKGIILGSTNFISKIQEGFLSGKTDPEIPQFRAAKKQKTPEEIIVSVKKIKTLPRIQDKLIVYALKCYSQLSLKQIGERLYNLHYSSISQISRRLLKQANNDKKIKRLIREVDNLCKMSNVKT